MTDRYSLFWNKTAPYSLRFIVRVVLRLLLLLIIFNGLYLLVQPLDRTSLTLYNHLVPGRLRFTWTDADTLMVNEFRLDRLVADHVISRPKAANEYRAVVLGSSDEWGYFNRPQETMPVVLDSLGLESPDGRILRSYNAAYVFADAFKDLLIMDTVLEKTDKPDLFIFTVNSDTFKPVQAVHWLADDNPELALRLAQTYNLTNLIPLDSVIQKLNSTSWLERHNFFAERSDIAVWLTNQAYALAWATSGLDYPIPETISRFQAFGGNHTWSNQRPGVLNAVLALANSHHIPLLLVAVPVNYASGFDEWIRQQAQTLNVSLLDCSRLLPPQEFTNTSLHITPEGHRRLANEVAAWLKTWWADPNFGGHPVTVCPSPVGSS